MFGFLRILISFAASGVLAVAATANLDREIVLAPQGGATTEDLGVTRWQERAGARGADAAAFAGLGWAYIAKARRTLDAGFYKLAEKTADVIAAQFGVTVESRRLRAHALHNLHRFQEAEAVARPLAVETNAAADLALLSDALVEQGKIPEGVEALQRMVDLKPGVEAFSRIAQVRWLKGDVAGATEAMETAFRAVEQRETETQAWLLVRLAGFALQRGETGRALVLAEVANTRLPNYAPALLACGRALLAEKKYGEAIERLGRAEALLPLPEYQWWLADALAAAGRGEEAALVEQRLMKRGALEDPRTFSLFLATRRAAADVAVRLAAAELNERADIFSQDAVAWALFTSGEVAAADRSMRLALKEGTRDARLSLHAAEIVRAAGRTQEAREHLARAKAGMGTLLPSERVWLDAADRELLATN